jgi:hypothetical protein
MRLIAIFVLFMLAAFTGTAFAAQATDPSISDAAKSVFDAIMHGQGWAAVAAGVILAVALARKYMPASWTHGVKGDIIGTATAFVMAFAGAIATTLAGPGAAAMSMAVVLTALKVGVAAVGGYNIIHKLATWAVASGKLPAWALPIVTLLTKLIGSDAVTKAEVAGAKAVAADPPKGMAGSDKVIEVE